MNEALEILTLVNALEPQVLAFFKTLLASAQGKTGDQFLSDADVIWAQIKTNAQAEINPTA